MATFDDVLNGLDPEINGTEDLQESDEIMAELEHDLETLLQESEDYDDDDDFEGSDCDDDEDDDDFEESDDDDDDDDFEESDDEDDDFEVVTEGEVIEFIANLVEGEEPVATHYPNFSPELADVVGTNLTVEEKDGGKLTKGQKAAVTRRENQTKDGKALVKTLDKSFKRVFMKNRAMNKKMRKIVMGNAIFKKTGMKVLKKQLLEEIDANYESGADLLADMGDITKMGTFQDQIKQARVEVGSESYSGGGLGVMAFKVIKLVAKSKGMNDKQVAVAMKVVEKHGNKLLDTIKEAAEKKGKRNQKDKHKKSRLKTAKKTSTVKGKGVRKISRNKKAALFQEAEALFERAFSQLEVFAEADSPVYSDAQEANNNRLKKDATKRTTQGLDKAAGSDSAKKAVKALLKIVPANILASAYFAKKTGRAGMKFFIGIASIAAGNSQAVKVVMPLLRIRRGRAIAHRISFMNRVLKRLNDLGVFGRSFDVPGADGDVSVALDAKTATKLAVGMKKTNDAVSKFLGSSKGFFGGHSKNPKQRSQDKRNAKKSASFQESEDLMNEFDDLNLDF